MVCMEPTAEGPRTPVLKRNVRPGPRDRLPRARGAHTVNAWYVTLAQISTKLERAQELVEKEVRSRFEATSEIACSE